MSDCIFCKIASKDLPSKILFEDEMSLAFLDINPVAPTHVIVIPKIHIDSIDEMKEEHLLLIGQIHLTIKKVAKELGLSDGYRIINNCGALGGQTVNHLHFHILSGRQLQWPPG